MLIGIIAEYNPFHLGHAYQIAQVKARYPESTLCILMSGDVVQRGEFAILDKQVRAQLAVEHGADIVVEMPLLATLQAADYFSKHSVNILARLGCECIVFGSEQATLSELTDYLIWESSLGDSLQSQIRHYLRQGDAYPAAYQKAVTQQGGVWSFDPSLPNHRLSIGYLKANQQLAHPLEIWVLPRAEALEGQKVQSGSAIRKALMSQQVVCVPHATQQVLEREILLFPKAIWPYLRYQLLVMSVVELAAIQGVKEGLEHRLKRMAQTHSNWDDFCASLVNRRWTRSTIQRILLSVLLQLRQDKVKQYNQEKVEQLHLKVLAFNGKGQSYLKAMRSSKQVRLYPMMKSELASSYYWNNLAQQLAGNLRADNA